MFCWIILSIREGNSLAFKSLFVSINPLLLIASMCQDSLPFQSSLEPGCQSKTPLGITWLIESKKRLTVLIGDVMRRSASAMRGLFLVNLYILLNNVIVSQILSHFHGRFLVFCKAKGWINWGVLLKRYVWLIISDDLK